MTECIKTFVARVILVGTIFLIGTAGARAATIGTAAPPPTLFGKGPEVYLSPSFGPLGTKVSVLGLGFRPGARVELVVIPPNADCFSCPSIGQGIVAPDGRF